MESWLNGKKQKEGQAGLETQKVLGEKNRGYGGK